MRYVKGCYYPRLATMWKRLRLPTTWYDTKFAEHLTPTVADTCPEVDGLNVDENLRLAYTRRNLTDMSKMLPRVGSRSQAVRFIALKLGVNLARAKRIYWQILSVPTVVNYRVDVYGHLFITMQGNKHKFHDEYPTTSIDTEG